MAKAQNKVLKGKFIGKTIYSNGECLVCSGWDAILRGVAGMTLLGGVGILAGLTAKTKGIYTVAILWKDGEKSLIEIDEKLYKILVKSMF